MTKISGTFEQLWQDLEVSAKTAGIIDGDLDIVRSSVKNLLVTAGWADPSGVVSFVSTSDQATCVEAAKTELARLAPTLSTQRKLVTAELSSHQNKMQVLSAGAATDFTGTGVSASAPTMAKAGDRCPRCSGAMEPVGLVNDRAALYCDKDRVVLPLPFGTSLR